jgi:hypothetical protein
VFVAMASVFAQPINASKAPPPDNPLPYISSLGHCLCMPFHCCLPNPVIFAYADTAMIRCLTLAAACVGLHFVDPASLGSTANLPFGILHANLIRYLKWGLASWVAVEFNAMLNRWAENRWMWKDDKTSWDWKSEVAVVTGGSAGIGACAVKKLVSYGIKVAVMDISPLSEAFSDGMQLSRVNCCKHDS